MATHSNILTWRIPWIEEPGRLQSMESGRVDMTERVTFHFQKALHSYHVFQTACEVSIALLEAPGKPVLVLLKPGHHIAANQLCQVIVKRLNQPQPRGPHHI